LCVHWWVHCIGSRVITSRTLKNPFYPCPIRFIRVQKLRYALTTLHLTDQEENIKNHKKHE
jgi:hypothetical protein